MSSDQRKPKKDRTSLVISAVLHGAIIGGILIWAWKTGKIEEITNKILQVVTDDKKKPEKKPEPVQQRQQAQAPKLPPINQGAQSSATRGSRMAVASDAPASGGDSFFHDTREQTSGLSTSGGSGSVRQTNTAPAIRPAPRPVTKPIFASTSTSVKQLLVERAKASGLVESFGSEQIAKSSVRDVGDIVAKISGSTIVDGKFAVIRGLSDRYTSTLFNGAEIPSGNPYRRSVPLDLFPSSMVDRVAISKSWTPDQPGGTGGGTIDVITKSFPAKPFVKATVGTSYNEQSNLKGNFLADPRSSMAMYDLPTAPKMIEEQTFTLTAAPPIPGPASSRETVARASQRAQQANSEQALLQNLGTADFAGVAKSSPLNSSFNVSAGDTLFMFEKPLGVFAGLNYGRNFKFLDDVEVSKSNNRKVVQSSGHEKKSNITTDYGVNLNLGYRPFDELELGFNYLLAHTADEEARHTTYDYLSTPAGDTLEKWQLHYTEREINNYQFRGKLELPVVVDSQLDWVINKADTSQSEPDHRFMNYFVDAAGTPRLGDAGLPPPTFPSRYFRDIKDDGFNTRLDWKLPFLFAGRESNLKAGWFNSHAERNFREQYFGYEQSSGFDVNNPNSYLNNPAYLNYQAQYLGGIRTNYNFSRVVNLVIGRPYQAESTVKAQYLMTDVAVLPWLRLIGGARIESTKIDVDASIYGATKLEQTDVLPAISSVVSLSSNVSLRLSYARTVARPSFRELAPISNYDPENDLFIRGNPSLKMPAITSYDARLEWFPAPGELFSFGVFYKDLKNPIELISVSIDDDDVTWVNRDKATLMGVEIEARKSLRCLSQYLDEFTLGANIAFIKSETKLTATEYRNKTDVDGDGVIDFPTSQTRPLYDQSPYVINLDFNYDHPATGTSASLSANLTGERILLTTAQGADIYEHPPVSLDANISQKIGRNVTFRFGVRNILDSEYTRTYGSESDAAIRQSYKRGRTYGISISAEF